MILEKDGREIKRRRSGISAGSDLLLSSCFWRKKVYQYMKAIPPI